jgi:hypothetical protein
MEAGRRFTGRHAKPRPYADGRGPSEESEHTCDDMNKRSARLLFPQSRTAFPQRWAARKAHQRSRSPAIFVDERRITPFGSTVLRAACYQCAAPLRRSVQSS